MEDQRTPATISQGGEIVAFKTHLDGERILLKHSEIIKMILRKSMQMVISGLSAGMRGADKTD